MPENGETTNGERNVQPKHDLAKKMSAAAWGMLLIWIGIVFLLSIPRSIAMLGMGVITLGAQVVRRSVGLRPEGFWIAIGILFVVGGLWGSLQVELPLFPIVLIVAGAALLLSMFRGRQHPR